MTDTTPSWTAFWGRPHSIYVNARHLDAHYRDVAKGIVALLPAADARVLDFGSGEAIHADRVADAAADLVLCDAAASVRDHLRERFADNRKIHVLSPDEVERLPPASLDLIVTNSVVQYLDATEIDRWLKVWRRLLAVGGRLVVADVVPPGVSAIGDARALLRYAWSNGFLIAAIFGVAKTAFSSYRKIRATLGITRYREADIVAKITAQGFKVERMPFNLEHNQSRMTFLAQPV